MPMPYRVSGFPECHLHPGLRAAGECSVCHRAICEGCTVYLNVLRACPPCASTVRRRATYRRALGRGFVGLLIVGSVVAR